jgi:cytochrome c oxidase cbb3-type subunit III
VAYLFAHKSISLTSELLVFGILAAIPLVAQPPAGAARPARPPAYPTRPPADPVVLERGKALYGVNCNFCHGSDARGGEGGPNLLRSEMVLNDKNGEGIAGVVQNGRMEQGMPKFPFTIAQISDIATYIHSFKVGGYDVSRMVPLSIVVGDAKEGEAYFKSTCASCHSVTGDLKGIGAKISDPKALQNTWLMPGGGGRGPRAGGASPVNVPPTTVTVTPASGGKVDGRLIRVDDFIVTLAEEDGSERTFRRDGDTPKVEIHDPLQPHKDLLPKYTDKDIHNLTSYLVTVK